MLIFKKEPNFSRMNNPLGQLGSLGRLQLPIGLIPEKRKIFVSYHHDNDQYYYNSLSIFMGTSFVPVQDNSLNRLIDSENPDYVIQRIRDNHISGTSCTIVLCGSETGLRKHIDWEIKGTLDKEHGLIGIALPTCKRDFQGKFLVPGRLHDNIGSGFALFAEWNTLFPPQPLTRGLMSLLPPPLMPLGNNLKYNIDAAAMRPKTLIINSREKMKINGVPT